MANRLAEMFATIKKSTNNLTGAVQDPQFWNDVGNNAETFMMPVNTPTTQGLPSEDQLKIMTWADLRKLRDTGKLSQQDHNYIAPYEHRAYAREFVNNPYDLIQNSVLTMGYTPYKQFISKGRSDPSLREIGQGLVGGWEGMTK